MTFIKLYKDQEENIALYKEVFEKLRLLKESQSEYQIGFSLIEDDEGDYTEVYGIEMNINNNFDPLERFAIEFNPWKEWLGMEISKETAKNYNELEIISHCLYEMTFYGFTEEEIQNEISKLNKIKEEYDSMSEEDKKKHTKTLDELLRELKKDQ